MMASVDLQSAAAGIIAAPAPVFMLDTCAIIDLLRSPFLHTQKKWVPASIIDAAQRMLDSARLLPRRSWLVITELVKKEFHEQLDARCKELEVHLDKLDHDVAKAIDVCQYFSTFLRHPLALRFFQSSNLSNSLRVLACDVVDACLVLQEDATCKSKAVDRVLFGKAPAARGKQELKDCHIVEHYLELSKRLSNAARMQFSCMVSSNVNDYQLLPPKVDPDLAQDFSNAGLLFASDMTMALAKSPI